MKNYKEMADSVFQRSNEIIAENRKRRKKRIGITSGVLCVCFVALIGFGGVKSGLFGKVVPGEKPGQSTVTPPPTIQQEPNDYPIVFGEGNTVDSAIIDWNGKKIDISLQTAFQSYDEKHRFAITASYNYIDSQFVFNGKTLGEYESDMLEEKNTLGKLWGLLKDGDYLRYGESLYQTGTPDGEKWDKDFYDKTVQSYGKEFLEKYIQNGVFLRDKVNGEIENYQMKAEAEYEKAYQAYMADMLESTKENLNEHNVETELSSNGNYLILYATEEAFASLSFKNASEWFFGLEGTDSDAGQDLTVSEID